MSLHAVTGSVDSGKTTFLAELYSSVGRGVGILSPKVYSADGRFEGYDAVVLPEGERFPLARIGRSPRFRLGGGRFGFDPEAFRRICVTLCSRQWSGPLWIDEIGAIEIAGGGLAPVLRKASSLGTDIFACVRPSLVLPVAVIFALPLKEIIVR